MPDQIKVQISSFAQGKKATSPNRSDSPLTRARCARNEERERLGTEAYFLFLIKYKTRLGARQEFYSYFVPFITGCHVPSFLAQSE